MENIERRVRREVRAMTRREVIMKVLARRLTWLQTAQVLGVAPRILLPFEIEPPIVQGQETAVRGSRALDGEASRSFGNQRAQR